MPTWNKKRAKYERQPKMYFGVELELCTDSHTDHDKCSAELKKWGIYHYESLDCGYPIEIAFHPGTFRWWQRSYNDIKELFAFVNKHGGYTGTDYGAGMHVHFSNILNKDHLYKVFHFVYAHPDLFFRFSERDEEEMDEWSSCDKAGDIEEGKPAIVEYWGVKSDSIDYALKYHSYSKSSAIAKHGGTVEVRCFAATLDIDKFYANIEMVASLIEFTYSRSLDKLTLANYSKWIQNKAMYQRLVADLTKKGLLEIIQCGIQSAT